MKAQPRRTAKLSLVEFAVLVGVCPLAGVGAGLAFASVLVGLVVAGFALIAVGVYGALAYGLAANLVEDLRKHGSKLRLRRDDPRRLSVTDIANRRRDATPGDSTADAASGVAERIRTTPTNPTATALQTERVVPLRLRAFR
jgi:hypothetical protein